MGRTGLESSQSHHITITSQFDAALTLTLISVNLSTSLKVSKRKSFPDFERTYVFEAIGPLPHAMAIKLLSC